MASLMFIKSAQKNRRTSRDVVLGDEPRLLETKHVPKGHLAVLENPGAGSTDDAKIILVPHYKDVPIHTTCPYCKQEMKTRVTDEVPHKPVMCLACCWAGFFTCGLLWCWCLHSYSNNKFTTYKHSCSRCKKQLGTFKWD